MVKNWIFIISIICFGCTQNKISHDVIPRDTFKEILIEVQNAKSSQKKEKQTQSDSLLLLNQALIKYGVSDTMYQKTVLFYAKRPEEMLGIIKEIETLFDK